MTSSMNYIRRGTGKQLLLIHGLGGSWREWSPILDDLAAKREVIAVDLPGFGVTPPLPGEVSIRTLSDAVTEFLISNELIGIDAVGSSMGARLVLELARRGGVLGAVVSLDPGGFWRGWERHAFYASVYASVRLVRLLQPVMPFITGNAVGRTLLFPQFSAHPWQLSPEVALAEMRSFAASASFDELLHQLAYGEMQQGAPLNSVQHPRDRMGTPRPRVLPRPGASSIAIISRCAAALVRAQRALPAMGCPARNGSPDSRQHQWR